MPFAPFVPADARAHRSLDVFPGSLTAAWLRSSLHAAHSPCRVDNTVFRHMHCQSVFSAYRHDVRGLFRDGDGVAGGPLPLEQALAAETILHGRAICWEPILVGPDALLATVEARASE
ncbi:unnamed protein product [Prorocentrum cordatum]|uniref:Uncharacterized protein n=1 Tax=Prorocentrum cordatum TaxID=2364126 RepID=A0ABN9QBD0_9DINO|nr:unnamed protein product [Polarella glacialis]